MVSELQQAVTAIYDAHNTHPSRRTSIESSPDTAYLRATTVAMDHITHEGSWPIGNCDLQLAHLEWLLNLYGTPSAIIDTPSQPSRLRRILDLLKRRTP